MVSSIKQQVILNLKNIPGPNSNRRLVVIECDDWGSVSISSQQMYEDLVKCGLTEEYDRYNKYDTLAGAEDLEKLFNVLYSVTDSRGKPAVMTPFTIMANPDFEKIKAGDFKEYFYESFRDTFNRYEYTADAFIKWEQGIKHGIFMPELHGREHISIQFWLSALQAGNKKVLQAFDHNFVAVAYENMNKHIRKFRPELFFSNKDHIPFLKLAIDEAVDLFHNIFGYNARVFAPTNGIFHPVFESKLVEKGIRYLYTSHINPIPNGEGGLKRRFFLNGRKTNEGITYYTRNCAFEPTSDTYKGIDLTLKQISAAFRWHKPAVISTHRVNFVGGINKNNREKGLNELSLLLKAIVNKWSNIEFVSSREMLYNVYT